MRLEQLLHFQKIAQSRSMHIAAEKLYITQPALSESIKNLEKELGYPLFTRSHKGMILTAQGLKILPIVDSILIQSESLYHPNNLGEDDLLEGGILTMEIVPAMTSGTISNTLLHFTQRYPQISFNIVENGVEGIINDVQNRKCDLGLFSVPATFFTTFQLPDGFILDFILSEPLYYAVNINSPLAAKKSLALQDLSNCKLSVISSDDFFISKLSTLFENCSMPSVSLITTDFNLILDQISRVPEIASIIYTSSLDDLIRRNNPDGRYPIKFIPSSENLTADFVAFYHKDLTNNIILNMFIQHLKT